MYSIWWSARMLGTIYQNLLGFYVKTLQGNWMPLLDKVPVSLYLFLKKVTIIQEVRYLKYMK